MIDLLTSIVSNIICWIETAAVFIINLVIAGIAALIATVLALLPTMPTLPSVPTWVSAAVAYVAYWFPIDYFFSLVSSMIVLILAWFVIAIPLRWARAISGNR